MTATAQTPRLRPGLKARIEGVPPLFNLLRRTRRFLGRMRPPRRFPEVAGPVHNCDWMLRGSTPADYARIGREAVALIDRALAGGRPSHEPLRVIDYGAGFGRVTRYLAERFGAGNVTVFDVDNETTTFCARALGVRQIRYDGDFAGIDWGTHDVAWLGSVLTHMSADYIRLTLASLRRMTPADGVIVVTTMGDEGIRRLRSGRDGWWFHRNAAALEAAWRSEGTAFQPYTYEKDRNIGIAWITPAKLAQFADEAGLRVSDTWIQAWDDHHDVHVLRHR